MAKIDFSTVVSVKKDGSGIIMEITEQQADDIRQSAINRWKDIVRFVDLGLPSGKRWADRSYGAEYPDRYGILYPFDDAQKLEFPDGVCMPTYDDYLELCHNTDWEWTKRNGINGYLVKSKVNENSIFFPCSGYGGGQSWDYRGSHGYYWSSSLHSATNGRHLYFRSGGVSPQFNYNRCYGFAVRPVQTSFPNQE